MDNSDKLARDESFPGKKLVKLPGLLKSMDLRNQARGVLLRLICLTVLFAASVFTSSYLIIGKSHMAPEALIGTAFLNAIVASILGALVTSICVLSLSNRVSKNVRHIEETMLEVNEGNTAARVGAVGGALEPLAHVFNEMIE